MPPVAGSNGSADRLATTGGADTLARLGGGEPDAGEESTELAEEEDAVRDAGWGGGGNGEGRSPGSWKGSGPRAAAASSARGAADARSVRYGLDEEEASRGAGAEGDAAEISSSANTIDGDRGRGRNPRESGGRGGGALFRAGAGWDAAARATGGGADGTAEGRSAVSPARGGSDGTILRRTRLCCGFGGPESCVDMGVSPRDLRAALGVAARSLAFAQLPRRASVGPAHSHTKRTFLYIDES